MQKVEVKSDAISAVQYSRPKRTLTVWYRNGGIYEYENVTEYLYRRLLLNQPHPWHYIGKLVKEHEFIRLDKPREKEPARDEEAPLAMPVEATK